MKDSFRYLFCWVVGLTLWVRFVRYGAKTIDDPFVRVIVLITGLLGSILLVAVITTPAWAMFMLLDLSLVNWLACTLAVMLYEFALYYLIGLTLASIWPSDSGESWLAKPFWLTTK